MDACRREKKEHGTREFPFQIYSAPDAKDSDLVPYHWHPEVEIIAVLQGQVDVTIRDEEVADFIPVDPWLHTAHRACGRWWAGELDVRDPRVSPAFGPVEGLRHVTIFAGTREILNPDSVKLYGRLDPAGDRELVLGEGMFHVYPLLPIPEAKPAIDKIVEKITRRR